MASSTLNIGLKPVFNSFCELSLYDLGSLSFCSISIGLSVFFDTNFAISSIEIFSKPALNIPFKFLFGIVFKLIVGIVYCASFARVIINNFVVKFFFVALIVLFIAQVFSTRFINTEKGKNYFSSFVKKPPARTSRCRVRVFPEFWLGRNIALLF